MRWQSGRGSPLPGEVRFFLLGQSRTGTSLLLSLLQSHPHFHIGQREPLADFEHGPGEGNPVELLESAFVEVGGPPVSGSRRNSWAWSPQAKAPTRSDGGDVRFYGCRLTPEQLLHASLRLDALADELGVRIIIVLTRRMALETLVSLKIVRSTHERFTKTPPSVGRVPQAEVSAEELHQYLDDSRRVWINVGSSWPPGLKPSYVRYEDLAHDPAFTVERLWRVLGVDAGLVEPRTDLLRQHPFPVRRKVTNYQQLPLTLRTEVIDVEELLRDAMSKSDSTWRRLALLGGGIIVWHCADAQLKERTLNLPGFTKSCVYLLTFMQACCVVCVALLDNLMTARSRARHAEPGKTSGDEVSNRQALAVYATLGVLVALSGLTTNATSWLVNYTTQVVFKSSKLPWVMAWRVLFLRGKRKPAPAEWACAMVLTSGLILFTYATGSGGTVTHGDMIRGLTCIVIAMSCDASRDTLQEAFRSLPKERLLLTMQAFSIPVSGSFLFFSGTYAEAMMYARREPLLPALIVAASVCSYLGQRCVVGVIHEFDSSVANLVTSVRKVVTMLLSFLVYPKPFRLLHAVGVCLIVFGSHGAYRESRRRGRPEAVVRPAAEWREVHRLTPLHTYECHPPHIPPTFRLDSPRAASTG
eukprot:TRINITY_DN15402_c0_g1_i1.p1 TRINITY_DN15402_c0_g1~~TRINITY_DN15402_c0_g1_i1.p1  ORF type:complete len:642 (+),score=168.85 TRINITY_DN15402_c0_g1_i1:51-1976(+)